MEVPSRLALATSCLNVLERLWVPSVVKLYECFEKNSLLASLTKSVLAKCLSMAWLECFEPERGLSPLGAGGSPQSNLLSGSANRHALHRIW